MLAGTVLMGHRGYLHEIGLPGPQGHHIPRQWKCGGNEKTPDDLDFGWRDSACLLQQLIGAHDVGLHEGFRSVYGTDPHGFHDGGCMTTSG